MFLWKLFDYLASHKWAQWTLAIVSGLFIYKIYERARDMRIRKQERTKITEQIDKENRRVEDAVDQADRDAVERLNREQLRKLTERDPNNRGRAPGH
jgi:biopolymer transport protein ExbB/TolQ